MSFRAPVADSDFRGQPSEPEIGDAFAAAPVERHDCGRQAAMNHAVFMRGSKA
jgi:hypothetical protein